MITYPSLHRTSKIGDSLLPPRHLILTLGADFNSHGLMFKDAIYHFLGFSSHGYNSKALFLSHQLISVALHGSIFHLVVVYVPDLIENFILLRKRKIPPNIFISLERFTCIDSGCYCTEEPYCFIVLQITAYCLQVISQRGTFFS